MSTVTVPKYFQYSRLDPSPTMVLVVGVSVYSTVLTLLESGTDGCFLKRCFLRFEEEPL